MERLSWYFFFSFKGLGAVQSVLWQITTCNLGRAVAIAAVVRMVKTGSLENGHDYANQVPCFTFSSAMRILCFLRNPKLLKETDH